MAPSSPSLDFSLAWCGGVVLLVSWLVWFGELVLLVRPLKRWAWCSALTYRCTTFSSAQCAAALTHSAWTSALHGVVVWFLLVSWCGFVGELVWFGELVLLVRPLKRWAWCSALTYRCTTFSSAQCAAALARVLHTNKNTFSFVVAQPGLQPCMVWWCGFVGELVWFCW
jgi:hypothetical protein